MRWKWLLPPSRHMPRSPPLQQKTRGARPRFSFASLSTIGPPSPTLPLPPSLFLPLDSNYLDAHTFDEALSSIHRDSAIGEGVSFGHVILLLLEGLKYEVPK